MSNTSNIHKIQEAKQLLSTFDGCSVECLINQKSIFESDNLVLFAKDDALYVEDANRETMKTESTRLVILYSNIERYSADKDILTIETFNHSIFSFNLKCQKDV